MSATISVKSKLGRKADAVLGATAAAFAAATGAGVVGTATNAEADIVWSGPVNIIIPDNIDGIYMNIVTGATGSSGGAVPGWDINPYSALSPNTNFNLWGPTDETFLSLGDITGPYNLPAGTMIDGTGSFFRPAGANNLAGQVNLNSSENLFGFRFVNEDNADQIHFGWFRVQFGATVGDRAIVEYAYDDIAGVGIAAGAIPEPSTFGLLAAGAVGLLTMRRRRRSA